VGGLFCGGTSIVQKLEGGGWNGSIEGGWEEDERML